MKMQCFQWFVIGATAIALASEAVRGGATWAAVLASLLCINLVAAFANSKQKGKP